jgi:hypothetical protein
MAHLDRSPLPAMDSGVFARPKLDRRQHRTGTPDCPRCRWDEMVSVVTRGNHTLTWRCARCAWSWIQAVPAQAIPTTLRAAAPESPGSANTAVQPHPQPTRRPMRAPETQRA